MFRKIKNLTKLSDNPKYLHLVLFGIYVLAYFILRITASPYLDWDEAEQYIQSRNFTLGDGQQPPLYSWIVRLLSILSGDSTITLISVRYLCLYIFILFIYLSAKQFLSSKKSFIFCLLVLALIPSYAYTINFKLTHSVLVFAVSAMSFYYYIRILRKGSLRDFLLFGVCIGLGLISKYNYAFLLGALFLASIFTMKARESFLRPQIFASILCGLFISLPHYFWLYKNFNKASNYLSERGNFQISTNNYNYFSNLVKLSLSSITQILIFTVFLLGLYILAKSLSKRKFHFAKTPQILNEEIQLLIKISVFSYLLPISIFLLLKSDKLLSGWLSVSHFITALALYLVFDKVSKKHFSAMTIQISTLSIVILFFVKYLWIFHPALFKKINTININYLAVSKQLEALQAKNKRIICEDQMIYVNLKRLHENWKLTYKKDKYPKHFKQNYSIIKISSPLLHTSIDQHKNQTLKFLVEK